MNPRFRVLLPGLLVGVAWSMVCITPFPLGVMYGPFAMLVGISPEAPGYSENGMWVEVVILLAMIVVHPVRPNVATGMITGLGLFLWYFVGLMYMFDGV